MSRVDDSGETDSPRSGQLAQRPRELSARETVQNAPLITNSISAPVVPGTKARTAWDGPAGRRRDGISDRVGLAYRG